MKKEFNVKEIRNQINKISFKGFNNLHVGDALYFEIKYNGGRKWFHEIREMRAYLEQVQIETMSKGNGKYLFLAEKDNAREDHVSWAKKIWGVVEDADLLVMWNRPDGERHKENHKYLYLLPIWFIQLCGVRGLNVRRCWHYACWMAARYPFYKLVEKYVNQMPNLQCLITHCDIHFCSSLATQLMNRKGVKTVTVAHSNFMNEDAPVYYHNESNYMVLYSELMLENAKKHNAERAYVVLGDPRCIGVEFNKEIALTRNKVMGVLLSYGIESEENMLLLQAAKKCAQERGYRLKIKKHPTEHAKELPIDFSGVDAEITASVKVPMAEYIEECDAVITGGTNAFFECVTMLKPTFLADVKNPYYDTIEWCKFSDAEGLERLLATYVEAESDLAEKMYLLREKVTVTTDVESNYQNFFETLVLNV